MRPDIVPGGTFPDYELPDHTKVARKLSELQGDDPLILTLARGHYCPKEHQQHLELAAFHPRIAVAYTQIATIATDGHHALQEFRASVGAQWPSVPLGSARRGTRATSRRSMAGTSGARNAPRQSSTDRSRHEQRRCER
jgi:peroxiredoxin